MGYIYALLMGSGETKCKLIWAMVLCVLFIVVEIIGGILANSLAVMTDAAHLSSDLVSFGISLGAVVLAQRPPTSTHSFGFFRAEVRYFSLSSFVLL